MIRNILISIFAIAIGGIAGFKQRPAHVAPPAKPVDPCGIDKCPCGCPGGVCVCKAKPKAEFPTWTNGESHACWTQRKNAVVFVGVPARRVNGFVACQQEQFCDEDRCINKAIVVGVWRNGIFERHDLPANATDAAIQEKAMPRARVNYSVNPNSSIRSAPVVCIGNR